ncbi:LPXTG cell wall anchor domain-containing protein [Sulfurimonas sp.]|uniref:LPXTG cell wall anchor domain-containing protein n=1 Tax=Sulfurimonas sp. TaxID=2022749 RepID=UPI002AB1CFCF|nr:LPXTG cell wall anchor domain-containing protein [Sulfurimonas sp.]
MIKLLLIFLLPLVLNASKILSYNIYDRTDRADVMITFDTPYEGIIKQSITESKIIIKLQDAEIETSKLKKLSSQFLYTLSITPMAGYTQITASVPNTVKLIASKTSDAYGLRLRFTTKASIKKATTKEQAASTANFLSTLPTKKNLEINSSYYLVIGILILGIIILLFIKKKATAKKVKPDTNKWLFKDNEEISSTQTPQTDNVSIRFQKNIDNTNSVVMLDFADQSYLLLMGNSNILLDKFTDNKPVTQEDFESILQSRHKELDNFLSLDEKAKEPLQAYKEKAASISYEV